MALTLKGRFDGKKILITGGTSGIGKATAERILAEGGKVIITGTNQEKLDSFQKEHADAQTLANDAGDPQAAKELGEFVKTQFGHVDAIFLNAGFGNFVPHNEVSAEEFDKQFAVNVRGPILHARELSGLLNDGGSILITASVAQYLGMEGGIVYNSTKGAVRTVVRVLAAELAPRNVRVNAISPGPIETSFFKRADMAEQDEKELTEQITQQVPLGRFGESEEVAAVATFLMSDDASYVTGSDYVVDGGMTKM